MVLIALRERRKNDNKLLTLDRHFFTLAKNLTKTTVIRQTHDTVLSLSSHKPRKENDHRCFKNGKILRISNEN